MERIGIVGLGRMGSAIARRMAAEGRQVTGWTRSGRQVEGIARADDLAALVRQSDSLILSLLDDTAVTDTLDALTEMDLAGRQIIETSTVVPTVLTDRSDAIAARGGSAVDAPISGGPDLVSAGGCGIFIGGTDAEATRAMATLAPLSQRIFHVGPTGAGLVMKVINNAMLQVYFSGLTDMLPLARQAGLPLETVLRILGGGPAGMPMVTARIPKITGQDTEVGFALAGAVKDSDVFLRVMQTYGLDAPSLDAAANRFRAGLAEGLGEKDVAALLSAAYIRQNGA